MKNEIPAPVVAVCIVVVCLIVGILLWKGLLVSKPALVPGGVHVTPPNRPMGPGKKVPYTGGGGPGGPGQ